MNSEFKIFNHISKILQKIAYENDLIWNESFLKWEIRSFEYDFSTNLPMVISFSFKKSKEEVFSEIEKEISNFSQYLSLTKIEIGHLNFTFKDKFYKEFFDNFINNPFPLCYKKKEKINVEFVSANPTGYLHIGHFRNALIGDAIANIYKFIGFNVSKEYYINDRGNQIDNLAKSVVFYLKNSLHFNINICTDDFEKDELYYGKSIEDVSFYLINRRNFKTESISLDNSNFKNEIVDFFISKIKSELELFGIFFDKWFSEKSMYSNKDYIEEKLKLISESSVSYKKNGAIFLKTSLFGDEKDRVIIKENGDFTYFLSDILYHINKLERSDSIINIWGGDHHGYVQRVKSSLKILGFKDVEEKINFVLIQMISLLTPDGFSKKFSKRLGNTIELKDALFLIKKDQLRFSLLETDANNHLLINTETLNREEKNSKLYYIQYAHARCNQIMNSWLGSSSRKKTDLEINRGELFLLNDKKEKKLIREIVMFEDIIIKSAEKKSPHIVLKHIYSLSSNFHSYYQSVPILNNLEERIVKQRVLLVYSIEKVLEAALKIFSIEPAKFMTKQG